MHASDAIVEVVAVCRCGTPRIIPGPPYIDDAFDVCPGCGCVHGTTARVPRESLLFYRDLYAITPSGLIAYLLIYMRVWLPPEADE